MLIKKIFCVSFVFLLLLSFLLVPVSAEETVAPDQSAAAIDEAVPESGSSHTINEDLRESEDYNLTKGSFYDTVYTLWYWIFGDAFTTSDKVCCILSVITIVWMMYLLIPGKRR